MTIPFGFTEVGSSTAVAEIRSRITARLGGCSICLELGQCTPDDNVKAHFEEIAQSALDLINQRIFRLEIEALPSQVAPQSAVDYSEDTDLLGIANVEFLHLRDVHNVYAREEFSLFRDRLINIQPMGRRRGRSMMDTTGDLAEVITHRRLAQQIHSLEPEWVWDQSARKLFLYSPAGPYDIRITKMYPHTLVTLPFTYKAMLMKACEGYARVMLAEIRGRYGDQVPGPTGAIMVDAQKQLARGEKLIAEVEDQLKSHAIPSPGFFIA